MRFGGEGVECYYNFCVEFGKAWDFFGWDFSRSMWIFSGGYSNWGSIPSCTAANFKNNPS